MNMLKSILTGVDGTLSSKRTTFLLLVAVFIAVVIVNLIWQVRLLNEGLRQDLVNLIYVNGGLVAAEKPLSKIGGASGNAPQQPQAPQQ